MSRPLLTIDMRMVMAAGIGTYLRELVPRILRLLTDFDICLVGRPEVLTGLEWTCHSRIRIVASGTPIYSVVEQIQLLRKIPGNTSVFWSPHYNIPILCRRRMLVTIHDTFHLAMTQFVKGWHRRAYSRAMFRAVRSKAAEIICVSEFAKNELLRFFPSGKQSIRVVHNGVAASWMKEACGPSPHPKPYLLFVGSMKPHKNLTRLLDAFDTLQILIPHDLIIIGRQDGFVTGDVSARQRASTMGMRVKCVGEIDHESATLKQFYASADALIMPSLYESFGLPALEAAALGCPIIVSRIGGLPEVYGSAALYCNPYDVHDIAAAILRMVTDRAVRAEYVRRARAVARKYDWDVAALETGKIIENLCS